MATKAQKIILILLILIFFVITFLVASKNPTLIGFDNSVNAFMTSHQSPFFYNLMFSMTKIGNTLEATLISVAFGLFLYIKNKKNFYIFALSVFSSMILKEIIRDSVQRARPYNLIEQGFSFPSGHAVIVTVFLLSSIYLLAPLIKRSFSKYIFLLITCAIFPLVAYSRIYLSVHWTSDVLAGIILGSICFIFSQIVCCQKKENVL